MKILNPEPEDIIAILTKHLAQHSSSPLTLVEKRIRQFLRGDNGTLAGALLHLCALTIRCRKLEHLRFGSGSRMGLEISFRKRNKTLHLIIKNAVIYPQKMIAETVNNQGRKIRVVSHTYRPQ